MFSSKSIANFNRILNELEKENGNEFMQILEAGSQDKQWVAQVHLENQEKGTTR